MRPAYRLPSEAKDSVAKRLAAVLAQQPEVQFDCLHGSFKDSTDGFNDIDVGVWLEPSKTRPDSVLGYQLDLSSFLERHVEYPVDVKVLNFATLGFQYAASGGSLLTNSDRERWFTFRERTWQMYLDYAPVARQALPDLLDTSE